MRVLTELQKQIEKVNEKVWKDPYNSWFSYTEISDSIQLNFYGEGYDDDQSQKFDNVDIEGNYAFIALLETLATISEKVSHLSFSGPDSGANGLRHWDFTRLVNSQCSFSNLKSFAVALTDPGDHNLSCLSGMQNGYEENGMIAGLVSTMPIIETLILPSAPDGKFFDQRLENLYQLRVESGYSSQDFINNYAESQGFKNLNALDFSDVSFGGDAEERNSVATSCESYEKLFRSKAFDSVGHFILRNSKLSLDEMAELQKIRPKLQWMFISAFSGSYVRHL